MSAQLATKRLAKKVIPSSNPVLSTALKDKKQSKMNSSIVVTPGAKRTRKPSLKVLESATITQVSLEPGVVVSNRIYSLYSLHAH
jgi:hypothetical protein